MSVKLSTQVLAFIAAAVVAVHSRCIQGHAAESQQATATAIHATAVADAKFFRDWAWQDEKWSGDDDAFAEARTKIDAQFKNGSDPMATAEAYKNAAMDNPHNALEQFRWAYACYREHRSEAVQALDLLETEPVKAALMYATQPHCYNYDRLRLLLGCGGGPKERGLVERLLKRNPNDLYVQFEYAEVLVLSKDDASRNKAVEIAQDLVARGQDLPECYWIESFIYGAIGGDRHDPAYDRKAIAALTQYLAIVPGDDRRRSVATQVINNLQIEMQKGG